MGVFVKVYALVLIPWLFLAGGAPAVVTAVLVISAGLLAPAVVYGWQGNIDQLIGRIQQKTGAGREAIEHYIDQLTAQGSSALESAQAYAHQAAAQLREGYGAMSQEARYRYDFFGDAAAGPHVAAFTLAANLAPAPQAALRLSLGWTRGHTETGLAAFYYYD